MEPVDGTEPVPHIAEAGTHGGADLLSPRAAVVDRFGEPVHFLFRREEFQDGPLDPSPDFRDGLFECQSLMPDKTDPEIVHLVAREFLRERAEVVVPGGEFLAQQRRPAECGVFPHHTGEFASRARFQEVGPDPVREGEPPEFQVFLDLRHGSVCTVSEFAVVRVDHLVEVPREAGVPPPAKERVEAQHTVREPRDQRVPVVQIQPGCVQRRVEPAFEMSPGSGTAVHDVPVVAVVPDEEPGTEVRYRLEYVVRGAEVVPGHEVGVAKAVGIFGDLVRRHEAFFQQPALGLLLQSGPIRMQLPGKRRLDHR